MGRYPIPVYIIFLILLIGINGCMDYKHEVIKEVKKDPVLDTIPFYPGDSLAFDTEAALKKMEEEEREGKRKTIVERLKERFKDRGLPLDIPDPWLPLPRVSLSSLPRALRGFPKDSYSYPDWQAAVRKGIIQPKDFLDRKSQEAFEEKEGEEEDVYFDRDIIFEINDDMMANVRFSHRVHNYWFSCRNCHPVIFIDKKGANPATMYDLWEGKYCGRCHGKVAFKMEGFKNCQRCHSVRKRTLGPR